MTTSKIIEPLTPTIYHPKINQYSTSRSFIKPRRKTSIHGGKMSKPRTHKIFIKDENKYWAVFWFKQGKNGDIYFGNLFDKSGMKASAHASGNFHIKLPDGRKIVDFESQKLESFKGARQRTGVTVLIDFIKKKCPEVTLPDGGLIIEIKSESKFIQYSPHLLEPSYESEFREHIKSIDFYEGAEISIFKGFQPWFVLVTKQAT
ncbi:hypothetical protein J4470_03620 [Candidatus Woesearchaeota archaeon]|nr:hypothetical protein [Candidatus Woesearchaeota archaeon]